MLDAQSGRFESEQIGSFFAFYRAVDAEGVVSLIGEARIPKRQPELCEMQQAYRQLTTAYRQYNIAVKNGNETEKEYWSQSAAQAMEEIQQIEQKLVSLNIEESVRKQILDLIQQAKNAEAAHQAQLEGTGNQLSRLDQSLDRMGSRLLQMASTMLVLRG